MNNTPGTSTPGSDDAFFKAVMDVAARTGWRRATLGDIAEGTGLSLGDLQARYASKTDILTGFTRHIDNQVLAAPADDDGSVRDRLFDVLMRRFDALLPYRDGLAVIVREAGGGVAEAICGGQRLLRSMGWMLEAAGVGSSGFVGGLRVKGLAVVWANTFMTWLRDDSEDMGSTMATLDRNLARAERLANLQAPWRRRSAGTAGEDGASGFPPPEGDGGNGPAPGAAAP